MQGLHRLGQDGDARPGGDMGEQDGDARCLMGAPGKEPRGQAGLRHRRVHDGVRRAVDDEVLVPQRGERNGRVAGHPVSRGDGEDEALAADQPRGEAGSAQRRAEHGDVDAVVLQRLFLRGGEQVGDEVELQSRQFTGGDPGQPGEVAEGGEPGGSDAQQARAAVCDEPDTGSRGVDGVQDAPRVAKEGLAGRRQLDPSRRAGEQRRADGGLELADRLGQRGLRHVQPLGGLAEVPGLRDGDEVLQVADLHASSVHGDPGCDASNVRRRTMSRERPSSARSRRGASGFRPRCARAGSFSDIGGLALMAPSGDDDRLDHRPARSPWLSCRPRAARVRVSRRRRARGPRPLRRGRGGCRRRCAARRRAPRS